MKLLKKISRNIIINDVIRGTISDKKPGEIHWRVLLLDPFSSKMVSSCCGMRDITGEGVTLVEDLLKKREPLPFLEAIYILKPTDIKSQNALYQDLNADSPPYKAFHVFFIEACPIDVFERFTEVRHISRIKTLREINLSFIPYESHVFLLENNSNLPRVYFNPQHPEEITTSIQSMAGQIATLCACLDENPSIRYRLANSKNAELAAVLDKKMQEYKQIEPKLGEGPGKSRSQLIILDRGFDCTSPVVHELTFEAMVHDLLPIENGTYKFRATNGEQKTIFLDDDDQNWHNLKHLHIADVSQEVSEKYKKFIESKNVDTHKGDQAISAKDLQLMVKKMPQFQKELTMFASQMNMASDCLQVYKRIDRLCAVEQDVATGIDSDGEKLKPNDFMNKMNPILLDVDKDGGFTEIEKIRLIIMYIISRNGILEDSLTKLFLHANINPQLRQIITNLAHLGPNVVISGGTKKEIYNLERKNREEQRYKMSRWIPMMKDIVELAMEDRLDKKHFPYHSKRNDTGDKVPMSTRYGQWYPKGGNQARVLPRLIIFVVGGISLSEIRSIYEVNKAQSEWEVVIGSTEVLTPASFLKNLENLTSSSITV